ncbi:hypothetical protein [Clostridium septicum]|uniref:Uncharacterized protein n=1 Tax=Clostridium septicum TaxID=1504 RepID=A0A9N7JKN6_CLOSE|nr:hypothetical protein [Clostridium septicum]AYE33819.1 hypothetical protein CP523_04695 [Clostridium septicum]UEC21569.1 hypothetical protein LK444_04135 [Clostridium septicum]USS00385.1 hypothetical protein NH397_12950 [Clostridium septicum]
MAKPKIKNLYNRDRLALTSISKCGHVRESELKNFIADKRINNYVKDNLVTREVFNKNNGEQLVAYKLTKEGKKLLEREWGVKNHYNAQSINHDLGISNKYFSLSEDKRETWKTETELRQELEEKLQEIKTIDYERYQEINRMLEEKLISTPDGAYIDKETGIETYFEVITNSYGQTEIEAKERFIEIMDIKSY